MNASEFRLIAVLYIISFLLGIKDNLAEAMSQRSGKFMLVETSDQQKSPNFLLVKNQDGHNSLIKVEKRKKNEETTLTTTGIKKFPKMIFFASKSFLCLNILFNSYIFCILFHTFIIEENWMEAQCRGKKCGEDCWLRIEIDAHCDKNEKCIRWDEDPGCEGN